MCWFKSKKDKEKIALLEQKVEDLDKLIREHIQNDMDMTEGDNTTWEEN